MQNRSHTKTTRRRKAGPPRFGRGVVAVAMLAAVLGCASGNRPWCACRPPNWPALPELDSTLTDPATHPILSAALPSNDRDWSPEQAVLARADFDGNEVTIHNIRNFRHFGEDAYTIDYYDKTFDLNDIESVDFIVVPFPESPNMAHTMLSFGFKGGQYVAVSVEARREKGETYDPIKGMLGQYELMYVVGDERDLVELRANQWLNDIYIYRAKATPAQARTLFKDVFHRVDQLAERPELYNTFMNNCTTNLVAHVNRLAPDRVPFDYRVWLNGNSDRLAYDLGLLETDAPFEAAKVRARVNYLVYLYHDRPDFSAKIRR